MVVLGVKNDVSSDVKVHRSANGCSVEQIKSSLFFRRLDGSNQPVGRWLLACWPISWLALGMVLCDEVA